MRERDRKTAERFGLLERIEALEARLLEIPHVVEVEFDLDGFYDDIYQVIMVPKYDIHGGVLDSRAARINMLYEIFQAARGFGLNPSGDAVEDYGEHYYIVRDCDSSWKELVERNKQSFEEKLVVATERSTIGSECLGEKDTEEIGLY